VACETICTFFTFFLRFFKIQKKHDFLRFFELLHTFSRTLVVKTGVQDTRKQADDGIGHYGEWRTNSHRLYGGETYYPERATRLQRSGSLGVFWCRSIRATVGIVMCYNTRRKVNNGSYTYASQACPEAARINQRRIWD